MIAFLLRKKKPPLRYAVSEVLVALFAVLVVGPITWQALDRDGPWIRVSGYVEPDKVRRGDRITATYVATPLTRYCSGKVQREVIDSQRNLWPKLMASTVATWEPLDEKKTVGKVVTPGVTIPQSATPGPAVYRVTTFWYCNSLQHWLDWPVVQVGPDLPFEIMP